MKGAASWLTAPFGIAAAIGKHVPCLKHPRWMNLILSDGTIVRAAEQGTAMPIQRKVFRIEEHVRRRAAENVATDGMEGALRHREFMAELQTLRDLIGPRAGVDRDALERARAQIAEAQAFNRYPVLNIHHMTARQAIRNPRVISKLMPTFTSEIS